MRQWFDSNIYIPLRQGAQANAEIEVTLANACFYWNFEFDIRFLRGMSFP